MQCNKTFVNGFNYPELKTTLTALPYPTKPVMLVHWKLTTLALYSYVNGSTVPKSMAETAVNLLLCGPDQKSVLQKQSPPFTCDVTSGNSEVNDVMYDTSTYIKLQQSRLLSTLWHSLMGWMIVVQPQVQELIHQKLKVCFLSTVKSPPAKKIAIVQVSSGKESVTVSVCRCVLVVGVGSMGWVSM